MAVFPAIPASQLVAVTPGVLAPGGAGLALNGLVLTYSTRVPAGQVQSFPNLAAVAAYFGAGSTEALIAGAYFAADDNSPQKPGAILFTQYPQQRAAAYLRGGSLTALGLAGVQALADGNITITVDGVTTTSGKIVSSAATSFSGLATQIQNALTSSTASSVTSSITLTVLTAGTVTGVITPGMVLTGTGVTAGTYIVGQLTGSPGAAGTYTVSASQTVGSTTITYTQSVSASDAQFTGSTSGTTLTAASVTGTLVGGQIISGAGITGAPAIIAQLSGTTGGAGTYSLNASQPTLSGVAMVAGQVTVAYDSISGGIVINSGSRGLTTSSITYAVTGTLATALNLTQATGAILSQGANIGTPATIMASVLTQTQNFASFMTAWEAVTSDALLFAQWNNGQNQRYAYINWNTDVTNTQNNPTASFAYLLAQGGYTGSMAIYAPTNQYLVAAAVMGWGAALAFGQTNARRNLAGRSFSSLSPGVTDGTIAAQLIANGVNFYGAYGTPNKTTNMFQTGSISGPFLWADSYFNQINLNGNLTAAGLALLNIIANIPFNPTGAAYIDEAYAGPIQDALTFGTIRAGVSLSALQAAYVNNSAGFAIDGTITARGWYLLNPIPSPTVRFARGPWPSTLFYTDGQSVQTLNLFSEEVA